MEGFPQSFEESGEFSLISFKCSRLEGRVMAIERDNERLVNHIYQIKRLVHRYRKQRRSLMTRLEKHKDNFREAKCPLFTEKESTDRKSGSKLNKLSAGSGPGPSGNQSKIGSKKIKTEKSDNTSKSSSGTSTTPAPKKPINPYLIYCQENRVSVQEKYQRVNKAEMTNQELTKALAQEWHDLASEEKQVYYSLFEQEKGRYETEMKAFAAAGQEKNSKPASSAREAVTLP